MLFLSKYFWQMPAIISDILLSLLLDFIYHRMHPPLIQLIFAREPIIYKPRMFSCSKLGRRTGRKCFNQYRSLKVNFLNPLWLFEMLNLNFFSFLLSKFNFNLFNLLLTWICQNQKQTCHLITKNEKIAQLGGKLWTFLSIVNTIG